MGGLAAATARCRRRPGAAAAAVVVLGAAAWLVSLGRMAGMDDGPGTALGAPGAFLLLWTTMMAAMMLPATAPVVRLHARSASAAQTAGFVGGYLAVWVMAGVGAFAAHAVIGAAAGDLLAWDRGGPYVAGAAVAAAGAYQLTPLKAVCLRHCRSPFGLLLAGWRPGVGGALRMGAHHGLWCVGCCWALMLVLFAVGVMSLPWMGVVAAAVLAERTLPAAPRLTPALGVALVALGAWIAVDPAGVPLLTEPGGAGAMAMP